MPVLDLQASANVRNRAADRLATQHCVIIREHFAAIWSIGISRNADELRKGVLNPLEKIRHGYQIPDHPRRACGRCGVTHSGGDQLFPPPERPDPVASAGDLSPSQTDLSAGFRPDRTDHADVPVHRLVAPAPRGLFHRQAAATVFAGHRDGLHADRSAHLIAGLVLRAAPAGGRARRHGVVSVPSGIVAGRPHGLRRPTRLRPIVLPGRRQCRHGHRAAARRLHRRAFRTAEHRVVFRGGASGDGGAVPGRALVSGAHPAAPLKASFCRTERAFTPAARS